MYVELITILVRAKDDITRACRRCQSTLYIVFNIAKVGSPHNANDRSGVDPGILEGMGGSVYPKRQARR